MARCTAQTGSMIDRNGQFGTASERAQTWLVTYPEALIRVIAAHQRGKREAPVFESPSTAATSWDSMARASRPMPGCSPFVNSTRRSA